MIDWHSHILPNIDDGSRNEVESERLVKTLRLQGVEKIVATPHFFANDTTVDAFLEKRQLAYDKLYRRLDDKSPEIFLGAEVRYYPGISKMADLKKLKISGSQLLLLEMQPIKWTEYTVKELTELASFSGMAIVLAHVERYFGLQSRKVLDRLYESGILMQTNASYFTNPFTKRNAINDLKKGNIHFIGSDCHNMTSRPPQMDKAFEVISKKLGERFVAGMNEYGLGLLKKIKI